jgi:glycosyltransferase involved in cell wall biosynthesis
MSHPGRNRRPRVAFVLEQTLGHITHAANLKSLLPADDRIEATFAQVAYAPADSLRHLPGYGNWTVRAGLRARRQVIDLRRKAAVDALFVHTQVPAILLPDVMHRIPTVVSLDATPLQYDELGAHYGHARGNRWAERLKWNLNRACFRRASAIVTWAAWTKAGLIDDYQIAAGKITVVPPGVDISRWSTTGGERTPDSGTGRTRSIRVLFVGGDFERKGGAVLLDAVARVADSGVAVEADLVTRDEVIERPGVTVHHGLDPNSDRLIELYRRADVFCLPTLGDCLPMVLSEAGAMGLPLVATDVGAIKEIVHHERTGLLVRAGDAPALAAAIGRLAADRELRRRLGDGAAQLTRTEFNARTNAKRIVDTILSVL